MFRRGELAGRTEQHGAREWLRIDPASIDRRLATGATVRPRGRRSRLDAMEAEMLSLTTRLERAERSASSSAGTVDRERDDLRSQMVALQDALARMRAVAELQRDVDRERAAVIEHLQAALAAGERADELRRSALAQLEDAVATAAIPGHLGDLPRLDSSEGESG